MAARYSATRSYAGVSAEARAEARRRQLVDAAIHLYGTQGYAATGVKQLCREAGVTDRYFYESFGGQAELFAAAYDSIVAELLQAIGAAVLAEAGQPDRQARAAVDAFLRTIAADPARAKVLFVEVGAVGGDVARDIRASTRRFAELLAATARPHLPADTPEVRLTMAALSLVGAMGIVVMELLDGDLHATLDDVGDYFVDMLLAASRASTA
jgi:AcrR family transcriptional regulator